MSDASQSIELRAADSLRLDPADWEARAADVYRSLADEPDVPREAVRETLLELVLADAQQTRWVYDGTAWLAWDGQQWRPGRPSGSLWLLPFTMTMPPPAPERPPLGVPPLEETEDEVLPADPLGWPPEELDDDDAPAATFAAPATVAAAASPAAATPTAAPSSPPAYRPTHVIPSGGLPAWATPDPSAAPVATLDAGLDVMLVEQRPEGWARVVCSNGWSAWLDGRRLASS